MASSVVSTKLPSLWVFAALFLCILHCIDPSFFFRQNGTRRGKGLIGGLGNAQKGGSRDGREGVRGGVDGRVAQSPNKIGGQVFCGGDRIQRCTCCGSGSMSTQQEADRGDDSIPSFGRLSYLPMTGSSPQLWEEVSCGLAGPPESNPSPPGSVGWMGRWRLPLSTREEGCGHMEIWM